MTLLVKRGAGTPVTSGTTWATLTNAVDGVPPAAPATYATWTNAVSSAVGYIEVTGYDFAEIGAGDTLNAVTVTVRHLVNNTGRVTSITFQPYSGATPIGSAQTATLLTTAHDNGITFPVTKAQLQNVNFKVRVTITHAANTQSLVFSIDHIDVTADYTSAPISVALDGQASAALSAGTVGRVAAANLAITPASAAFSPGTLAASLSGGPDPADLAVMVTGPSTATLSWDAAVLAGVVDYSIFRRTPPTSVLFDPVVDTPVAAGIIGLTYSASGLLPSTQYEWQVFGRVSTELGSPLELPSLTVWYDASDESSLVVSGSGVSQWSDKSGNGKHLVQATGSQQPITGVRNINGRNVLDFDGVNSWMQSSNIPYPSVGTTAYYVFIHDVADGALMINSWWSLGGAHSLCFGVGGGNWYLWTPSSDSGVPMDSDPHVFVVATRTSLNYIDARVDEVEWVPSGVAYFFAAHIIGFVPGYGPKWNGVIGEYFVYDAEHDDDTIEMVMSYLHSKWFNWDPTYLPNLEGWWDASDESTIVSSGGLVSSLADKSGNGNDMVQPTGSMQPTTGVVTQNGKNALSSWGSRNLRTTISPAITNNKGTWWAVFKAPTGGYWSRILSFSDIGVYDHVSAASIVAVAENYASNGWGIFYVGMRTEVDTGGLMHAIVNVRDGDISATYLDGSPGATGGPSAGMGTTNFNFTSGAIGVSAGTFDGGYLADDVVLCEVGYCSSALSDSDRNYLNKYLEEKWGLLWTPADLPNVVGWYDASDLATITESGGAVSSWASKAGTAPALVQATGSSQPISGIRTINDHNVLDFDGSNDYMTAAIGTHVQPVTYLAVVQNDNITAADKGIMSSNNVTEARLWIGSGYWVMYAGSIVLCGFTTNKQAQLAAIFNGASSTFYVNGTQYNGALSVGVNSLIDLNVGGAGGPWDGAICELVVIDGIISSENLARWNDYYYRKWWIPTDFPGLVGWWDASDLSSITSSSGAVSAWADKSGNGFTLSQATESAKPHTGLTTVNGKNVLLFDGSDFLMNTSIALTSSTATVFVVLVNYSTGTVRVVSMPNGINDYDGVNDWLVPYSESGTLSVWMNGYRSSIAGALGAPTQYTAQRDATDTVRSWKDGIAGSTSVVSGVFATEKLLIGAEWVTSVATPQYVGRIAEIVIYSTALTNDQRLVCERYLRKKWGTP